LGPLARIASVEPTVPIPLVEKAWQGSDCYWALEQFPAANAKACP